MHETQPVNLLHLVNAYKKVYIAQCTIWQFLCCCHHLFLLSLQTLLSVHPASAPVLQGSTLHALQLQRLFMFCQQAAKKALSGPLPLATLYPDTIHSFPPRSASQSCTCPLLCNCVLYLCRYECRSHGVYEVIAGGLPLRCRCCAWLLGDLWCFACFAGPPLPFIPFGGLLLTTPMPWGDCSASAGLLAYMDALLAELMLSASPIMSAFASTGCASGPRASDVTEGLLVSSAHPSNTIQHFTKLPPDSFITYMDVLLVDPMLSASPMMSAFASTGCARGPRASDVAEGLLVSSAHQSNTHQKFTRHRSQILIQSLEHWLSQMLHYSEYP